MSDDKPFKAGTLDFVEDAVQSLVDGGDSYVLFVIRDKTTIAETFLNESDKVMLREWVDTGYWNEILSKKL